MRKSKKSLLTPILGAVGIFILTVLTMGTYLSRQEMEVSFNTDTLHQSPGVDMVAYDATLKEIQISIANTNLYREHLQDLIETYKAIPSFADFVLSVQLDKADGVEILKLLPEQLESLNVEEYSSDEFYAKVRSLQ